MDFQFNEQEKMIQQAAREWATEAIAPRAAEIDKGNYPLDILKELGRLGPR